MNKTNIGRSGIWSQRSGQHVANDSFQDEHLEHHAEPSTAAALSQRCMAVDRVQVHLGVHGDIRRQFDLRSGSHNLDRRQVVARSAHGGQLVPSPLVPEMCQTVRDAPSS